MELNPVKENKEVIAIPSSSTKPSESNSSKKRMKGTQERFNDVKNDPRYNVHYIVANFEAMKRVAKLNHPKEEILQNNSYTFIVEYLLDFYEDYNYRHNCSNSTIFMAVNIVTRYLNEVNENLSKKNLHLLAVTSFYIALNLEEKEPPTIRQFHDYTMRYHLKFDTTSYVSMEEDIWYQLDMKVCLFSPIRILELLFLYSREENYEIYDFAELLLVISLHDISMNRFDPILNITCTLYLSHLVYKTNPLWSDDLRCLTRINEDDFTDIKEEYKFLIKYLERYNIGRYVNKDKHEVALSLSLLSRILNKDAVIHNNKNIL